MQNRSATLILLTTDPAMGSSVTEAARLAFSPLHEVPVLSLEEALQRPPSAGHDELLILQDPSPNAPSQAPTANRPRNPTS